jgi:hypothetical protein
MKTVRSILTGSLITLMLGLALTVMVLVTRDLESVQADINAQPIIITVENDDVEYAPLTDAPPQRDITTQRFAPLEVTQ